MENISHPQLVQALAKKGEDILKELTPEKVALWHMATGIATEAGELLDAVKAHVIYGKPLDMPNVIEELGDLEFYLEGLRQELRLNRESILLANIEKLSKRYAGIKYSNEAAIRREDKRG